MQSDNVAHSLGYIHIFQDIANNFAGTLMGIINALGNTMG